MCWIKQGGKRSFCWFAAVNWGTIFAVRLFQDQIYQKGDRFICIVRLDRYEVEYKTTLGEMRGEGVVAVATKKDFCRLLKGMALVFPEKREK